MKKAALILSLILPALLCGMSLTAQNTEYDFYSASAGDFYKQVYNYDLDSIAMHGPINSLDLKSLRRFARHNNLRIINLHSAQFNENLLPHEAFYDKDLDGCPIKRVILPEGIKTIGSKAFKNSLIESIDFPKLLKDLMEDCFSECKNLKSVTIPGNISFISYRAFEGCENLEKIELLDGVEYIEHNAFSRCDLRDVVIPNSVVKLGDEAFAYNVNLKSIKLSESIQGISTVVKGCDSLEDIELPEGMLKIWSHAFEGSVNLKSVKLSSTISEIYEKAFKDCEKLESIEFSDSIYAIYACAFLNSGLEKISFSKKFSGLLCPCAFGDLSNLKTIYCECVTPPKIIREYYSTEYNCMGPAEFPYYIPFGGSTNPDVTVYVPVGCAEAYRRADGWDYFHNFIELEELGSAGIETATVAGGEGGMTTRVYSLSGTLVAEGEGAVDSLTPGLYIVNSAEGTRKLLVK